jgi:hypothetical protein
VIAGAFAFDKVKDFVTSTIAAGDAVGDQAARLNLSSRALEEWTYAAKFADLQAGELDGVFNKLARSSVAAGDASSEQGKVLDKLGVKVKDANGNFKDTGTLFEEVGLALNGLNDQTERTSLSMTFFGKTAGPKVLQLFKDGPEGIKKFRDEFQALGGGMGDFVEQAGAIDDNMHRLDLAWTSAKVKIVGLFLPAVTLTVAALTKLSTFLSYVAKHTYLLEAAIAVLGAAAIAWAAPVIAAWAPVIAPFLLIAAAIAAVVLVVEDLIVAWKGGDSLIGRIIDRLFGKGATARTVAWIKETGGAFAQFWSDLTSKPGEFAAQWQQTSNAIQNDLTISLGPTFGGVIRAMLDEGVFLLDALTGGWQNFSDKVAAVWDGIKASRSRFVDRDQVLRSRSWPPLDDAVTATQEDPGRARGQARLGRQRHGGGRPRRAPHQGQARPRGARGRDRRPPRRPLLECGRHAHGHGGTRYERQRAPGTPAQQARALGAAASSGAAKGGHEAGKAHAGVPLKNPNRAASAALGRAAK